VAPRSATAGRGILELMDDEANTNCPYCGERVDPHEPAAVYAVERVEVTTFGPTHEVIDGLGSWFHEGCPPEAAGYAQRPPPAAPS
jgi:hypothetical protein